MSLKAGMMYEAYMVTKAGVVIEPWGSKTQKVFKCDLLGNDNHKLYIQIHFETGSEQLKIYEAIKPYMVAGALLHIEFVYRWYNSGFHLCIATFKKATALRCDGGANDESIAAEEYFNVNRGYWARAEVYGEWVQFPGVIDLGGEVVIPTDLHTFEKPKLFSYSAAKENEYALMWVKKTQNWKEKIKKLLCFKK